jgi:uncharacterized membrane protein YjjP (DUF1212 family)
MASKREPSGPPSEEFMLSRMRDWRAEHESELTPDNLEDDEEVKLPDARAINLVLRVGELMLASGESTEAVSEAMLSLTVAFDLPRSEVSVTFTTISLSTHPGGDNPPITGERVVRRRTLDYFRVNELHTLVQDAALGLLELEDAKARLEYIRRARMPYRNWMIAGGFGLIASSASVMVADDEILGRGGIVAIVAFLATVLGDRAAVFLANRGVAEFYQMAGAAVVASTIGVATLWMSTTMGWGLQANAIITGNIIALLPGRPLVSSLQDGISGSYVSAAARLLETFFILGAIVIGVVTVAYTATRLSIDLDLDNLPTAGDSMEIPVLIGAAAIAIAFAISLAVPPRMLPTIGVLGVLIWVIYASVRSQLGVPPVVGTVVGAITVGVVGHWLARRTRRPVLPYLIPSIAPLLPGSILYRGLIEITQGTTLTGLLSIAEAVTVALALGAGVNLGGELVRAFQRGGLAGAGMRSRPAARRTRGGY